MAYRDEIPLNKMKVSVITICKDAADTIEDTIESVLEQDYPDLEYIIIDGKSSDGTIDLINSYRNRIHRIISEKDSGIFDAMNKGYRISTGDIINYMNAGDFFANEKTISGVVDHFNSQADLEMIYGDVFLMESKNIIGEMRYSDISGRYLLTHFLCHQAVFSKRHLIKATNGFSIHYKTHSDYEWLLNIVFNHKAKTKYIREKLCYFDMTGVSASHANFEELRKIRRQYYGLIKTLYADLILCFYIYPRYVSNMMHKFSNKQ